MTHLADLILREALGGNANLTLLPDVNPTAVAEKSVA